MAGRVRRFMRRVSRCGDGSSSSSGVGGNRGGGARGSLYGRGPTWARGGVASWVRLVEYGRRREGRFPQDFVDSGARGRALYGERLGGSRLDAEVVARRGYRLQVRGKDAGCRGRVCGGAAGWGIGVVDCRREEHGRERWQLGGCRHGLRGLVGGRAWPGAAGTGRGRAAGGGVRLGGARGRRGVDACGRRWVWYSSIGGAGRGKA